MNEKMTSGAGAYEVDVDEELAAMIADGEIPPEDVELSNDLVQAIERRRPAV
jgi:hypothetical protein